MSEKSAEEQAAERADANLERIQDYAWNWFNYHAGQRTSMFNYSLAAAALLAAGYGAVLEKSVVVAQAIGFVGAAVMLCFMLLDFRNRRLVDYGERALEYVETVLFANEAGKPLDPRLAKFAEKPVGLLLADLTAWKPEKDGSFVSDVVGFKHRVFLPLVEGIVLVAFLAGGIAPLVYPSLFA